MELEENKRNRLQELSDSDFEIADNQPDIISWEIFDSAGDYIGDVEDLIFDTVSLKVRYIVSNLDGFELETEKLVLIPIGLITLNLNEDEVLLTEAISNNLPLLPAYEKGLVTPVQEIQIREVLTGTAEHVVEVMNSKQLDDEFYNHRHFDDQGYNKNPPGKDGHEKGEII